MDLNPSDAYILEKVVDPNSMEFRELLTLLLKPADDGIEPSKKFDKSTAWKYTLPYRGEPETELEIRSKTSFKFPDKGHYRNGSSSLSYSMMELVDLVEQNSTRRRITTSLCVSDEFETLQHTLASSGSLSTLVGYSSLAHMIPSLLSVKPETMVFDHTSSMAPVDAVINAAYSAGVTVVDGVFPYHVAAAKGWDVVSGTSRWSYCHSSGYITVGPDDDSSRLFRYKRNDYMKFVDPSLWQGKARYYGYELRGMRNGLVVYRAIYLGDTDAPLPRENLSFSLPVCSSDDLVLLTINRDLAAGVFTSKSNNASELSSLNRNYAIEVRKDLFISCVDFLISKDKNTDIVGDAIRYISTHNYVDLMDGVKIVRIQSLSYSDALCVAIVCALEAFALRYRLTNESIPDIKRTITAASLAADAPLGALGRMAWLMSTYVKDHFDKVLDRAVDRAIQLLYSRDYIPGICYDVYASTRYSPDLNWFEPTQHEYVDNFLPGASLNVESDAFTSFLGDNVKTAAPTLLSSPPVRMLKPAADSAYKPNLVQDPLVKLQHFYDEALPGNSTSDIQNVAELRRVRDVNINTEFFGKIQINKDIAAPEKLHRDMSLRSAALPVSRTPLLDSIMASAKRNFNPPDLQVESDPFVFAKYLVDKFIDFAFVPGFRSSLSVSYKKDLLTFNVMDYLEWKAMRDGGYKSALEAECPEDMVELELERYDTIVKKRIKPKLTTGAQYELSQPQVIVSMSKKDTALFTSVFRKIFERFDSALKDTIKSAGRSSDADISDWLTANAGIVLGTKAIELDSGKYDKSQNLLARMIESLLFIELGLDPNVNEIFADSYVGRVSSRSLGLMFVSAYQMKSGAPQTMLGNLVYNMVSAMESVGAHNIYAMIAKGDDNVVWVRDRVDTSLAVSKMSSLFNLEAKLVANNVIYFSSGFVVPVDEKVYFAPDVLKITELLGEGGVSEDTIREQHVSFADRVSSVTKHYMLPEMLQKSVRLRLGVSTLDVVGAVDSLCVVARDFELFKKIKLSYSS